MPDVEQRAAVQSSFPSTHRRSTHSSRAENQSTNCALHGKTCLYSKPVHVASVFLTTSFRRFLWRSARSRMLLLIETTLSRRVSLTPISFCSLLPSHQTWLILGRGQRKLCVGSCSAKFIFRFVRLRCTCIRDVMGKGWHEAATSDTLHRVP